VLNSPLSRGLHGYVVPAISRVLIVQLVAIIFGMMIYQCQM